MPPVQQIWDFPGIPGDLFTQHAKNDIASEPPSSPSPPPEANDPSDPALASPAENVKTLIARSESSKTYAPGKGTVDPNSINMQGLMALFAILGFAFVAASIWFFFWAKNGGFVWRKGDWEEYKSTVLRRKGPDGRTLSNATKSTKLGGGSIVGKGYSDYDGYTESGMGYTDTATTVTNEKGGQGEKEGGGKKKRGLKEAAKRKFMRRRADEQSWNGEEYEDDDVRAYRQEKAARVGGINREAEGTYHGSDYDTSNPPTHYNRSEMSEARDYAYHPPPPPRASSNTRRQSQRKSQSRNFSFNPGTEATESQITGTNDGHNDRRIREPTARRHNRRRERRRNLPPPSSSSSSSHQGGQRRRDRERRSMPGHLESSSGGTRSDLQSSNAYSEDESGTRSYHHPIPGLSKGYRREGGRRKRRDSLSDSDGEETRYS